MRKPKIGDLVNYIAYHSSGTGRIVDIAPRAHYRYKLVPVNGDDSFTTMCGWRKFKGSELHLVKLGVQDLIKELKHV